MKDVDIHYSYIRLNVSNSAFFFLSFFFLLMDLDGP